MKRAIQFFLRYPVVTLVVAALAAVVGLHALLHMPRMEDPSITNRTGLVIAAYPGATTEQVEQQVTRPIESHLFQFPEIRKSKTFATSRPGLVILNVELEDHVQQPDVFWAKLRAELELTRATELPQGVMGPMVDSEFGETVAMLIAIHGDRYGYRELRDYADQVKDQLRAIRQVGRIVTYGQQAEQIWITGNPGRLAQFPEDPAHVIAALNQRNTVAPSGSLETASGKIPFRTPGLFDTEAQIRNLIIDVSPGGQPVKLGDLAQVERRYQEPEDLVRFDGQPCLLISVEMQKGENIVDLGASVADALARVRRQFPSDLKLDFIANQPQVVGSRMHHLGLEFLLAIGAVILVAVILLPMRVAIIAALAIPVTMLGTLGLLNAIGIELHQVSIAALIVVLGIVVDDAIVITDNYLELLDHGVPRGRAAWRSAAEVFVPVLTATLTIIASFLPLLILNGDVGEFIRALPITVALALSVSFLVAICLTPLLCRTFIRKGIKASGSQAGLSLLDRIQAWYRKAIATFMRHKAWAVGVGALAIAIGGGLFAIVPEQFFPSAERNQFVIDLWMPEGTKFEATRGVFQRIEQHLRGITEVDHFATFVGDSAPRFYYNVDPQQSDAAYGQMVVNTKDEKKTEALVGRLQVELAEVAPEGLVIVKELQQGDVMEAPVEFRVAGADLESVKVVGRQVEDILLGLPESRFVHTDHFNDSPIVNVNVNPELANRLGLSHAGIAELLAGGLDGAPVSTFWEGDRAVPVLLRIDAPHRGSYGDVRGTSLTSPLSQGNLPLGAVATLNPGWQPSRLVRRNGMPTLTVRSFVKPGSWASDLQAKAEDQVSRLPLPPGVHIEQGGEFENQGESFPSMVVALGISLLAIFLVLLVQFRNLAEPLIIMTSIPLSIFGAMLGLVVTGNPFGFTAFIGMISLCGIVVRNAIILVDYIKERRRAGIAIAEAAMEAGARRLRPIFLTTMAAAMGVLPMILSGSKLWSPLASVIAVGLIFSMIFTLLVVPVIYVIVMERKWKRIRPVLAILGLALAPSARSAEPLTLQQCLRMASERSSATLIAEAKVEENHQKVKAARTDYLPQLTADWNLSHTTTQGLITIPAGGLGNLAGTGPLPTQNVSLDQGSNNLSFANLTFGQPLTQLWKIRQSDLAAQQDLKSARADLDKARSEIRLAVQQAYFGILIARQQQIAAHAECEAVAAAQQESHAAVQAGNALQVLNLGSRAGLLQARQKVIAARHEEANLTGELKDLIGFRRDEPIELSPVDLPPPIVPPLEAEVDTMLRDNPAVRSAQALQEKSLDGIRLARLDYVPDVGAFVKYTNQSGVPFLKSDFVSVGIQASWTLFDWGKRSHVISQRMAESAEARENLRLTQNRVRLDTEKAYRKLEDAQWLLEAADQAAQFQSETLRIATDQREAGLISPARLDEAKVALAKAELEALQARFGVCLAGAEIERALGKPLSK
ncbi:MAG: efflux RND transporter permease subunit [Holophaga sp.]|nr:efflux RND transporter permease subunit [Holophaga sp.]